MSLVVLDTDVASALLRCRAPDALARRSAGQVPAITFVTVGGLIKWTLVRSGVHAAWKGCGSSPLGL